MFGFVLLLLITLAGGSYGYYLFPEQFSEQMVTYLQADTPHIQDSLSLLQTFYSQNRVHIYCRRRQPLNVANIFQSNRLQLSMQAPNLDYMQYKASTARAVYEAHLQRQECQEGKLLAGSRQKVHYISISSHEQSCYGIYTDQAYNLTLHQLRCDDQRVLTFVFGLLLWLLATLTTVAESLLCCYCVAIVLGVYLSSFVVVWVALLLRGHFQSWRPLGANFKLVLEQYPASSALALIAGAWLLLKLSENLRSLWRYQLVRSIHCRLVRLLACLMLLSASDHASFGWCCVCLLLPWPELWWLLRSLWRQYSKLWRMLVPPMGRRLLSEEEFSAQSSFETQRALIELRQRLRNQSPDWEQMAQLQELPQFAQFVSSGSHPIVDQEPTSYGSSTEVEVPYRNVAHTGSNRSLRQEPRSI